MSDIKSTIVDASTPQGAVIFNEDGFEYRLVAWTPHGVIAKHVTVSALGDEHVSQQASVLDRAFTSPVDSKLNQSLATLELSIAAADQKLADIKHQIATAERRLADAIARASSIPALSRIHQFIDGKVTHFVLEEYGQIQIEAQAKSGKPDYNGRVPDEFKLLTLYGASKGDLSWKINRYNDGSGHSFTCVPCTSYEEAIAEATKIATRLFDEARATGVAHLRVELVRCCVKLGIAVPADVIETLEHKHDRDAIFVNEQAAKIAGEYAKSKKETDALVAACKAIASKQGGAA